MKEQEAKNYNGWLNSDSFFKRAIGIALYNTIGSILIYIIIAIPILIIMTLAGAWR